MIYRANPDPSLVLYRDRPQAPINGVGRLPAAMTINGTTEYPTLRYTAGGGLVDAADWRPWGYGENLDIVAVATPPTLLAGSPGLGPMDQSVYFPGSDYFTASGNSFADITTEDFVLEVVIRFWQTPATYTIDKYTGGAGGWLLWHSAGQATTRLLILTNGGGASATVTTGNLTDGCFYHLIAFMDRSGSGQWYVDGSASGAAVNISGAAASISIATPLLVGNLGDSTLSYAALWKGAGWLDTHLQATVAEQRASLFWGWRPQQARGTAVPTARTRASNAYLDRMHYDGTRRLYLVGNNVPRCVERVDKNGATLRGYLSEVQITNLCLRSEEINVDGAGSPWTHTRASVTNTSTTTLPNGLTSVNDVIHEDATASNNHRIAQAIAVSTSSVHVISFWSKAINRDHLLLSVNGGGVGYSIIFDLTTGVADVSGGGSVTDAGMIPYGNGWYRCWTSWTPPSTPATFYFFVHNGTTITFNGLDQDSIYCWGVQLEAGVNYPTSYMPTAAAAVIREEDVLRYKGDDGNLGGVGSNKRLGIKMKVLAPDVDLLTGATEIYITDGGGATNRAIIAHNTADDRPIAVTDSDGGSQGSCQSLVDIFDGEIHELDVQAKNNLLSFVVDNEAAVQDTDCDMPDDLDRIEIGARNTALAQANFPIADIELFPRESRN